MQLTSFVFIEKVAETTASTVLADHMAATEYLTQVIHWNQTLVLPSLSSKEYFCFLFAYELLRKFLFFHIFWATVDGIWSSFFPIQPKLQSVAWNIYELVGFRHMAIQNLQRQGYTPH